nr:hypothetical protein [Candidatus Bipolaricaulota bacterium]
MKRRWSTQILCMLVLLALGGMTAAAAAPTATVQVSDPSITPADVGATFTVTVTFNQTMSNTVSPTVTFDPLVSGTLTGASGAWDTDVNENDQYTVSYTVACACDVAANVDVQVSGAQNPGTEVMVSATLADAFDVERDSPAEVGGPAAIASTVECQADAVAPTL